MDEILRSRYAALVSLYEPTDPFEATIKRLVAAAISQSSFSFRPDAEYFLIVNCVEMILRPYAEEIRTSASGGQSSALPRFRDLTPEAMMPTIEKALDIVIANVSATDTEVSSHDVMLALDRAWPQIAQMLWWG